MLPRVDYLLVDLINRCNLDCIHCRADKSGEEKTISLSVFSRILEEARDLGIKTVTFSGGEPFLKENIFEYIQSAKDNGFITRVQTNSLLLNREKIAKLKDLGLDYLGTGMDGLETSHDKMRNKKGAFSKLLEILDILREFDLKVHIEFTATNFNYLDFEKVVKLCQEKGVYDIMTRAVLPSGKGKSFDFALSPDQYKEFLKNVIKTQGSKINLKLYCQDPVSLFLDSLRTEKLIKKYKDKKVVGGCSAGINMLYISPSGEVQPCSFLKLSFGNVYSSSFKEIANSEKRREFLNKQIARDFNSKCSACEIRYLCGGCRARALDFNGDLWGEDPFCFKTSDYFV